MLKYLWYNWRDGDASIVAAIRDVPLIIFHNGKNKARAELLRHKRVTQHHVKEMFQPLKQRKWCIEKMLWTNRVFISRLSFFHWEGGIKNIFECDIVADAITICQMFWGEFLILLRKVVFEPRHFLLVVWLSILLEVCLENLGNNFMRHAAIDYWSKMAFILFLE